MSHIIDFETYKIKFRRRTPSIFYFEDPREIKNAEVLKIMEKVRKIYPLVFCYQVKWFERKKHNVQKITRKKIEIICVKKGK